MIRDDDYWVCVRETAKAIGSDHCSKVPDFYRDCCDEHDVGYRFGEDFDGTLMTRGAVDARFRQCMQAQSWFGRCSPMAWWRWAAVRIASGRIWKQYRKEDADD